VIASGPLQLFRADFPNGKAKGVQMARFNRLDPTQWSQIRRSLTRLFDPCQLCPRMCSAPRSRGGTGACGAGGMAKVASHTLHHGEEPPVSGYRGSGTVFFSGCTLRCVFCQNYPISQLGHGQTYDRDRLAESMLSLQKKGAHNINLVSPTPFLPQIVEGLQAAAEAGLHIPVVYNTSGYERVEVMGLLDGIVDIYLPDIKYVDAHLAQRLSGVTDYAEHALTAVAEMWRQCGKLKRNPRGVGVSGLIVRHLILPGLAEHSKRVLEAISRTPFRSAHLSLMSQFFPAHRAADYGINRRLRPDEYAEVQSYAVGLGFKHGWFQELDIPTQSLGETDG